MALCYKDRQFCKIWKDCKDAKECDRAYTPEVEAAANKWWNSFCITEHGPPIDFIHNPKCYNPKTK